jgi:hypothetical protein
VDKEPSTSLTTKYQEEFKKQVEPDVFSLLTQALQTKKGL